MLVHFNEVMKDCNYRENFIISPGCKTENKGFFTCLRVDRNTLPKDYYAYDIRHGDAGGFCTVENKVLVNHAGTFLTKTPLKMNRDGCRSLSGRGGYTFV